MTVEQDKKALAESLYELHEFNVVYDFGNETVEGYFGPPTSPRWYRVTIEEYKDPEIKASEI